MAADGHSANQIQRRTGISANRAQNIFSRYNPAPAAAAGSAQAPSYSGTPAQYATAGSQYGQQGVVFDGQSWQRAQAAGYSDQQIRDFLVGQNPGVTVGRRPQMVLDHWETENPESYREFSQGPAAQYSTPGRVLFNPEGEKNIGLGRGGLQDVGITWYSTQGSADNDLSNAPYDPTVAANILENGKWLQTSLGMQRAMAGESPVPTRYMGDEMGNPQDGGQYAYGYDSYSSPGAMGMAKDWDTWNSQLMGQQAAVWESMDAINTQFLQQQQGLLQQQSPIFRSPTFSGGGKSDGAKVRRGKKKKSKVASNTISGAAKTSSGGGNLSLGGGSGNGLTIGKG